MIVMPNMRGQRINHEMQRAAAELIRGLKDPRIPGIISVTKAEVTKDQKFAKLYVSVLGGEKEKENAIEGLKSASAYLRREIGNTLKLRNTPEIIFSLDNSIEEGTRIISMINRLVGEEKKEGSGEKE